LCRVWYFYVAEDYNYNYMSNVGRVILMEVESVVQGAITRCKKFNYIDGRSCGSNPALLYQCLLTHPQLTK